MTEQTDAADVSRHDVETQARVIDPEAFEDHPIEQRRPAAALQWSARRHIAREHAKRILASDWLAADRAAQRRLGAEAVVAWLSSDEAESVAAAGVEDYAYPGLSSSECERAAKAALDALAARAAARQVGGER